ncbi:MAG: hypothetical protein IPK96_08525 [Flammeovirgaceae bacterium]|nr:hypothetical protein [Flammeovirgaceae bacterium]
MPTDPGYEIVYDGVFVPDMDDEVYVSKDKYNAFQLFAAVGLRSDFDLNDDWSINFDGRANFGILDTRNSTYLDQLKNPSGPLILMESRLRPIYMANVENFIFRHRLGFPESSKAKKNLRPSHQVSQPLL